MTALRCIAILVLLIQISAKGSGLMPVSAYVPNATSVPDVGLYAQYAETAIRPDPFVENARAQDAPLLDLIIERLGLYLSEYESTLSALVADEQYEQQEARRSASWYAGNRPTLRELDSEVTFLRLPGSTRTTGTKVAFGRRSTSVPVDVRRVNDKPVTGTGITLPDLLKNPRADLVERAAAIVEASSRHNLGGRRTINMPTVPLDSKP